MKSYNFKISLRLLFFFVLLHALGFGRIFHGVGMELTNNGTGIYYIPGLALNHESQIMANIGFHFDSATQTITYYRYSSQNRSVFMEISGGYRRELFKESIAGTFRPVFIFQGGGAVKLKTLSWNNIPGNWILMSAVGICFSTFWALRLMFNSNNIITMAGNTE